jgi:hypothetical protein
VTAPLPHQATHPNDQVIRLAPPDGNPGGSSRHSPATPAPSSPLQPWPLLILALPAAVAVWSGWVGIGQMTGFGQVHPLPGLWPSLHLNTAITLPVGVEAYAAYALRAWLTTSTAVSVRTRRFARWSAIASLLLGMAGQIAYHLLTQSHTTRAPWAITTAVSCLPVLVLGMGAALAHLLHTDAHSPGPAIRTAFADPDQTQDQTTLRGDITAIIQPGRLAQAEAAAARLRTTGRRVSRRTLRAAGIHASNAELGALAITLKAHPSSPHQDPTASPLSPTPA